MENNRDYNRDYNKDYNRDYNRDYKKYYGDQDKKPYRPRVNKQELAEQIANAAEQLAELLADGYQLELSTSRRGFQVYKMLKSHHVIDKRPPVRKAEQGE